MKTKTLIIILGALLVVALTVWLFWDDIRGFLAPKNSDRESNGESTGGNSTGGSSSGGSGSSSGGSSGGSSSGSGSSSTQMVRKKSSDIKVGDAIYATRTHGGYSALPIGIANALAGQFNAGDYVGYVVEKSGLSLYVFNSVGGLWKKGDIYGTGPRVHAYWVPSGEYMVKK